MFHRVFLKWSYEESHLGHRRSSRTRGRQRSARVFPTAAENPFFQPMETSTVYNAPLSGPSLLFVLCAASGRGFCLYSVDVERLFSGLSTSSRRAFSRGSVSRSRAAIAFASRASATSVAAWLMAAPSRAAVSFDRGMGQTPMPSRCVCRPQPYCSLRCATTTCGTPARDAVAVVPAPPWWTTAAIRGNSLA